MTLGWLAMTHPVGTLLAGSVWLALRIQARTRLILVLARGPAPQHWRLGFLAAGRLVFPEMDWIQTYRDVERTAWSTPTSPRARSLSWPPAHLPDPCRSSSSRS